MYKLNWILPRMSHLLEMHHLASCLYFLNCALELLAWVFFSDYDYSEENCIMKQTVYLKRIWQCSPITDDGICPSPLPNISESCDRNAWMIFVESCVSLMRHMSRCNQKPTWQFVVVQFKVQLVNFINLLPYMQWHLSVVPENEKEGQDSIWSIPKAFI